MPGDGSRGEVQKLSSITVEDFAVGEAAATPIAVGSLIGEGVTGIRKIVVENNVKHGDGKQGFDGERDDKETKKEEAQHTVPFTSLFKYADVYDVWLMLCGTAGAMGLGIAMPLLSLLFGQLTDAFGTNTQDVTKLSNAVTETAVKFVWVAIGAAIAAYLEMACWMLTGERQASRIRAQFLRAVLRQDVAFFDLETSTGEVVGRMSGDIILVQEAMGEKVGQYTRLMTTFVGGFAIAFARGWLLTLVLLAALPLLAVCGGVMTWVISRISSKGQEAYGEAGTVVEQCIGAIRTVASFTGESKAEQQYGVALDKAYRMGCRQGLFAGLGMGITMFVMFSTYALALWVGSLFIANDIGGYTGGRVMTVLFAVLIGGMSLGQASPNLAAFAAGRAAAYKIFEVIERTPAIDVYDLAGATPEKVVGEIELRHVKFSYPARPDVQIFSDFCLTIPPGKTVALVGESGSGKSTIISLIERFYDPLAGQVLLDGMDLRSLQLRWLRQQIGLVSQEPVLFGTSIRENIAYGKEDASEEEIVEAAKRANVHAFISSLPHGYDTEVGERGAQLSGGQKQRVAIARAIVKNPRILLLDEATSALDAESEHVVQEALERAMVARTTVVVAHRLTTIRSADLIAVLQRGVMVEAGSHEELVARPGGAYAQLVHLQQRQHTGEGREASRGTSRASSLVKHKLDSEAQVGGELASKANQDIEEGDHADAATEVVLSRNKSNFIWRAMGLFRSRKGSKKTEKDGGAQQKDVSFWRLAQLNKREWPFALLGTLAAGGQGVVFPIFSILLSSIIKVFYETDDTKLRNDADFWALMFLLLALSCFTLISTQLWMFAIVGSALVRRVRQLCFATVLRQEMAWFDDSRNSSGAIGARLSTDAARVRSMVGDSLAIMVQNMVTIVAGLTIAFTANVTLTLVVLAVMPLLIIAGGMQMKALKGFSENAKVLYEDASRVANDAVSSIRTVAAFCAEGKVAQLYDAKCSLPIKAGIRRGHVSGLGLGFSNFVMFATYALAFWYGGQLVEDGKTSFEKVFQVFFAILMSAMGVSQTSSLAPDMTVVQIAVNSIFTILDRKSSINSDTPGKILDTLNGDIELQNIAFRYPTRSDVPIFKNLSLSINAGQTVALVGESGSGKSTVVSLIERFYDPDSGVVLIDGIDIRELQLKWLRQQIGLVSQEPVLFNTSIRENIAYGHDGASEAEIIAAAMDSNAHKFISALPQGYDTLVGERGVQLSGGQKQRVAIARAIVKNPHILLLDEATSALDAESESVVQEALDRVMVGRTTVVIAHRLTTIRNADMIAVMQSGALVEQGQHDELLEIPGGAYASLIKLQEHMS